MEKKNVFLVVLDTVRSRNTSVYNSEKNTTPFLEDFSEDATVFNNAISQAPWTLPSHASMFTGKYPNEHGAVQENPYMEDQQTIASKLSSEEYSCGVFSANAWISPHTGLTQGFDVQENFLGSVPYPINLISSKAWKKFNASDRLQPIAKKISSFISAVHRKFTGKKFDSYTPDIMSEAQDFVLENKDSNMFVCMNLLDAHLPYTPEDEYIKSEKDIDVCLDSKQYNAGVVEISDESWDYIEELYDAEIRYLDDKLSEFVQFLKDENIYEESMIAIVSDHGELHGKGGIYGHEFSLYNELLNVPLLIKSPGQDTNNTDEIVELMDIYHTILDFTGHEDYVEERSIISDKYRQESSDMLQYPSYGFSEYSKPMIALHQIEKIAKKNNMSIDDDTYRSNMKSVRDRNGEYIYRSEVEDLFTLFGDNSDNQLNSNVYKDILTKHNRTSEVDVDRRGIDAIDGSIEDRLEELGYID